MTEPTDDELDRVLCNQWPAFSMQATLVRVWVRAAMRDALAKWGTQQPVAAPLTDSQAQAGAVPMSHEDAKALVRKYGNDPLHLVLQVERHHGIDSAPTTQPAPQQEARPVTPYTCPKCHALWLHWPAEQSGFAMDTLNCRSTTHCDYCEKGGVEQLQRLERVPAVLAAPSVLEDAARWRMLPAFFEEYQIDALKLYRDIDAYLAAARKQGANHE